MWFLLYLNHMKNKQKGSSLLIASLVIVVIVGIVVFVFINNNKERSSGDMSAVDGTKEPKIATETFTAKPLSATHYIIPSGNVVVENRNVLTNVIGKEGGYVNAQDYIQIPGDKEDNNNSHDKVDISFRIPDTIVKTNIKNIDFQMSMACGNYGEIFVYASNKFGSSDELQRIKCEGQKWEEKNVRVPLSLTDSNDITITLKRDGGPGQVKVDYVSLDIGYNK